MLRAIGWFVLIVLGVIVSVGLFLAIAFAVAGLQLPFMDINRAVTQHSNQYIVSHQEMLMQYYSDYVSGDDAHKAAAKINICAQAPQLLQSEWPSQIAAFVSENCQ